MRSFYRVWAEGVINVAQPVRQILQQPVGELDGTNDANVPQPVGQIKNATPPQVVVELPWGQNITLLEKVSDYAQRLWYANMAFENGWSRSILTLQIEYALRDMRKPIGVAEWQTKLVRRLPSDLRPCLPTVKEIESALAPLARDQGDEA